MMLQAKYPLAWPDGWPRTHAAKRRYDSFGCTPGKALDDLERELELLGCSVATITSWLDVGARGMRVDKARIKLVEPGVSLMFVRGDREYVMARDAFDSPFGNMRSIGLAIAGLRSLLRHGGSTILDRAFAGFQALPPPGGENRPAPPPQAWREILGLGSLQGPNFAILAAAEAAYRTLAKSAHPDNGGTAERMAVLNHAIAAARDECRTAP